MDSQEIRYEVQDRVATVTLYRPDKLNAFTRRMRDELIDAFGRADAGQDDHRDGGGRVSLSIFSLKKPVIAAINGAAEWVYTGRVFGADEALAGGLVSRVVAPDVKEGIAAFTEKRAPNFAMKPSSDMPAFYPWWEERPFK